MKLKDQKFNNIKNIVFDLGNVLLDINIDFTVRAFENLGLNKLNPEDIHPHNSGIFLDLELGNITYAEFIAALRSYAPEGHVPTDLEIHDAWNFLILSFDFSRFELLDKLRKEYNIFLLSNTNLPHREYLIRKFEAGHPERRSFESYFDKCFYSDAMHLRKPDTKIYTETLRIAGINAEESLFIDDNAHNLVGAQEVGLHTYHLARPETIHDLFE